MRLQSVSYLFFRDKSAWSVTQRSWDPYSQVLQNKERERETHKAFKSQRKTEQINFQYRAPLLTFVVTIF